MVVEKSGHSNFMNKTRYPRFNKHYHRLYGRSLRLVDDFRTRQLKSEKLRSAVYQIAQATNTTENLQELFRSIHTVLGSLMPAQNFFIALYDPATNEISYPYFVDENDPQPPAEPLGRTLTSYVLRTGNPLLASPEIFAELVQKDEVEEIGAPSIDWLGVPLTARNQIIGILALQSYTPGIRFTEEEMNVLIFVSNQVGMAIDRKRSEEVLRMSEARYRAVVEDQTDLICRYLRDGTATFVNQALCDYVGIPREELIGKSYFPLLPEAEREKSLKHLAGLTMDHPWGTIEHYYLHSDGRMRWQEWTDRALFDEQGNFIEFQSVGRDVTEEKQRHREMEAIIAVTSALRFAKTRAEMLPVILDQINHLLSAEGSLLAVYDPQHNDVRVEIGQGIWQTASGRRLSLGSDKMSQVIRSGKPFVSDRFIENPVLPSNPPNAELKGVACVPMVAQEHPVGAIWIGRLYPILENDLRLLTAIADIAASAIHRASLHEQTQQRLQRLTALRSIDMAISASLDLSVTLSIFINQIISQLGLDAAALLLLNPYTQMLEYRVGQGFRSASIRKSRLHLGESHAGKVALERRMEIVNNLGEDDSLYIALHNLGEDFKSYIGLPLVAKGQIKGVLELFQRRPFDPDSEWLEYVQALAARAAIAIDNGELFEKLQLSNSDMIQAYDATIEGWARALDLHDRATTNHSLRIVDITLGLIRAMGANEVEIQNIRWGVLLHDIGMIAIPDQILHKPGPLTDEEWQAVKQHPVHAFNLLSPILYLKKAIEIPYCHHEWWDGSGYPHGLKGEQIPFASRVFSVVDVWDALGSDRSFRSAWLPQNIRQYLEDQAGKQFDPQVVKAFLSLEKNGFKASQSLIL